MGIDYQYLPERNILVATATGRINPQDNERSNARVRTEMDRHRGLKLLVDMRAAEIDASPAAMIGMMDAFFALAGSAMPVAVIRGGAEGEPHAMLAETQAFIAGAPMRLFDDLDAAGKWLDSR